MDFYPSIEDYHPYRMRVIAQLELDTNMGSGQSSDTAAVTSYMLMSYSDLILDAHIQ